MSQEIITELREAVHKYVAEHLSCDCAEDYTEATCECSTSCAEARGAVTAAYLTGLSVMIDWLPSVRDKKLSEIRNAIEQAMRLEGIEILPD